MNQESESAQSSKACVFNHLVSILSQFTCIHLSRAILLQFLPQSIQIPIPSHLPDIDKCRQPQPRQLRNIICLFPIHRISANIIQTF